MFYVYKCHYCGNVKELNRKVADRNKPVICHNCRRLKVGRPVRCVEMVRQVTAPVGFKRSAGLGIILGLNRF